MKNLGWLLGIAAGVFLSAPALSETDPSRTVVAEINGRPMTLEEYNLSYSIRFRSDPKVAPEDWRVLHLERMVDREIAALEARSRGMKSDTPEAELVRDRRVGLVQELYRVYGRPDTIQVTEEEIRREYDANGTAYRLSAIMAATEDDARQVLEREERGEDFVYLARTLGKGAEAQTGGDMGWKTWRELASVPEFREAVLKLKVGELSDVIRTKYGYHVLRLEDTRPNKQPPYKEMWIDIFSTFRRERVTANMEVFRSSLEKTFGVEVSDPAVVVLVDAVQKAGKDHSIDAVEGALSPENRGLRLVSFRGGSWTVAEFLAYLRRVGEKLQAATFEPMAAFVRNQAVNDLLVREAQARGLENTDGFRYRMKALEEAGLESKVRETDVAPKARVTPADAEAYYNEHRSEFYTPEELHLAIILLETRASADSVLAVLRAGADFSDLARRRSVQTSTGEKGGDMGYVQRGRLAGLLDFAFDLKDGEVSDVYQYLGYWAVVKALDRKAPQPVSLEDATPGIVEILQPQVRALADEDWVRRMREKYRVHLHPERLS